MLVVKAMVIQRHKWNYGVASCLRIQDIIHDQSGRGALVLRFICISCVVCVILLHLIHW